MQLDLFTVQKEAGKQAATVYSFPLCRRADMIREMAAELLSMEERAGRRHWNAHVQKLRRELRAAGLQRTDIDFEIREYARAVRIEGLSSLPMSVSR